MMKNCEPFVFGPAFAIAITGSAGEPPALPVRGSQLIGPYGSMSSVIPEH
jgi:hypothetical protein